MKTLTEIFDEMEKNGLAEEALKRLYCDEVAELAFSHESMYEVILNTYKLGFFRGARAERNRRRKRKKQQHTNIRENSCEG